MTNEHFAQELTDLVRVLEKRSSVELVVVLAVRSGSYLDLEHTLAFLGSLLCLLYLIHSPTEFQTDLWVFWLGLAYLASLVLIRKFPTLWRPLTSVRRRRSQTLEQACCAFIEERVASTRDRSGMLLYVSQWEREVVFLTDLGVDRQFPQSYLHQVEVRVRREPSWATFQGKLLSELLDLEGPLNESLPAAPDDGNELDDQVRVRR